MRCGPELLDELIFPARPPWHRMGLQRIAVDDWLPPMTGAEATLRAKRRLLAWVPGRIVVTDDADPGLLDGVAEVLEPHREATAVEVPSLARFAPDERFVAAAAAVVDDVCVMERRDGVHGLIAGAVWFPSRWDLRERVGRSAREIHGPVPDDGSDMAGRAEHFMARIRPGDIWGRANWFVHDRPVRWAPRRPDRPRDLTGQDPPRLWVRSERQTLRALDEDVLIFTIRTRLAPVSVFAARPEAAAALQEHLAVLPDDLAAEKIHPDHVEPLLGYLDRCTTIRGSRRSGTPAWGRGGGRGSRPA